MAAAQPDDRSLATVFAAAAFSVLVWGITPAITSFQVAEIPPIEAGILRSVVAVPLALACIWKMRLRPPSGPRVWMALLCSGFAAFAGFPVLFALGVAHTSTAHAALVMAIMPLIAGALGAAMQRRMPSTGWFAGAGLAFAGEALLIGGRDSAGLATLNGDLIVGASVVISGVGYVIGSRVAAVIGTWATTFWGVAIAGLTQVPIFIWLAADVDWSRVGPAGWASSAYLVAFSTILAYAAWYWALNRGGVVKIAPLQFAQPLVGVAFAVVLLGEGLTWNLALTSAMVLGGVVLASRAERSR
ncbi:MAG: DMT family transporter [Proteobacteria bacterium]|nr:DMT family transporter [Pseudomonadota bacterium]